MKKALLFGLLVVASIPVFTLAAGFAKQSLFLSKSPVTEGDTVKIFAVVANENTTTFTGTVVFSDGTAKIASAPASIAASGAQTVSVSWKPSAGQHSVSAALTGADGKVVETETETFTIAEKPKPPTSSSNADPFATPPPLTSVDSSEQIQDQIKNYSPAVAGAASPLFGAIDSFRNNAAGFLDGQITAAKVHIGQGVAPSFGLASSTGGAVAGTTNVLWTAYLYILTLLRWLIGSAAVFYPFLAIAFFYALWRIYKRMRRPSY